jgi:prevent-host-death family protein
MIKTLRESKARLSELVDLASEGQEILITVRGKAKARLSAVENIPLKSRRDVWMHELSRLRQTIGKAGSQGKDALDDLREDRL